MIEKTFLKDKGRIRKTKVVKILPLFVKLHRAKTLRRG
jgi:hypothetical protein